MSDNIKKVVVKKKINGDVYDIYAKTSADNVTYNESNVAEMLDQISNGKFVDTTENWNSQPNIISIKGAIYIYSDYKKIDGENVPGIKIGDGSAYIVDLPFMDIEFVKHIDNTVIHVSQEDRNKWDSKIRCFVDENDLENLQFTIN